MEWNIVVGLVCTVLGATIGYATFSRSKEKDDRAGGQQIGIILTEVGNIKGMVEAVNKKLDQQAETNLKFAERLSAVEASARSAHHRLDRMEGKVDHEAQH